MSAIDDMQADVTQALLELEPWFKNHKLTFVARSLTAGLDADVIISNDDDHAAVAAVLLEHERRAKEPTHGG